MDVGPPLEQHLRDLEERLLEPEVRGAPDDLAILLDDGFVEFSKSGRIYANVNAKIGASWLTSITNSP